MLLAWREFLNGKRKRKDVAEFSLHLTDNVLLLHQELADRIYQHGEYDAFRINDPKPRDIHKATVRDRLVHHAIYRILYPYFDKKFIHDSYSCRRNKGTHLAMNRLHDFTATVSRNHTRTIWILKCDIRKFFANIDHEILLGIMRRHVKDEDVSWLLKNVIESFHTVGNSGVGLPLGNLTSQLLANIYMNVFDQFMKRHLNVTSYVRYADDFVLIHERKEYLEHLLPQISEFLGSRLHLELHPNKVSMMTLSSGVDFLGWVHFPHHRVLRTSTKRRMMKHLSEEQNMESLASYLGLLSHGNGYKLSESLCEQRAMNKSH